MGGAAVDHVPLDVDHRHVVGLAERRRSEGGLLVLHVPDVLPDELLRHALELVVERRPVDEASVLRLARDERPLRRHLADPRLGELPSYGHVPVEDRLELAEQVFVVTPGDVARVLVRELLGRRLVLAHPDELRADAELLEQLAEVHVLHPEPGVPEATGRVHDDAVGVGAHVEGSRAGVLPAAEDLLLPRPEHTDGVGELLGVGVGVGGLGAEDQRDRGDVWVVGDAPELAQERGVLADARRLLEPERHGVPRVEEAGLCVPGERRGRVRAGGRLGSEPVAEERSSAEARASEHELEPCRPNDSALLVVAEVGDGDVRARAPDARDVQPERDARLEEPASRDALVAGAEVLALHVEAELEVPPPRGPEGCGEGVAAVEDGVARAGGRRDHLLAGAVPVLRDEREGEVCVGPVGRGGRDPPEAADVRVRRVRVLDARADRELVARLEREAPRAPRVRVPAVGEPGGVGRDQVVKAEARREAERQGRGGLERLSAVDLLRVGAEDAGPADLAAGDEREVRRVEYERVGAVLARGAPTWRVEARGHLRERSAGPGGAGDGGHEQRDREGDRVSRSGSHRAHRLACLSPTGRGLDGNAVRRGSRGRAATRPLPRTTSSLRSG